MKVLVDRRHAAEKLVVEGVVTQAGCVLEAGDEGSVWKWRPAQHAGEEGELVWLQARYVRPAPVGATPAIEVDLTESDGENTVLRDRFWPDRLMIKVKMVCTRFDATEDPPCPSFVAKSDNLHEFSTQQGATQWKLGDMVTWPSNGDRRLQLEYHAFTKAFFMGQTRRQNVNLPPLTNTHAVYNLAQRNMRLPDGTLHIETLMLVDLCFAPKRSLDFETGDSFDSTQSDYKQSRGAWVATREPPAPRRLAGLFRRRTRNQTKWSAFTTTLFTTLWIAGSLLAAQWAEEGAERGWLTTRTRKTTMNMMKMMILTRTIMGVRYHRGAVRF